MCGIAGLVGWGDHQALLDMTRVQSHRGPDDRGLFHHTLRDGRFVGLGSQRLAILDLSPAGHMPMSTPDGRYTIVYNGEVYNSPELRRELEGEGVRFRSRSDTEVVLELFRARGVEAVERLNGIFAFGIWDREEESLFLARDPFGVKPLYYVKRDSRLAFASESKAFLGLPGFQARVDPRGLHEYLTFLWVPEPGTMLEGVRKLPPGSRAILRGGDLTVERYWRLRFPPDGHTYSLDPEEVVAQLRERLLDAVRRQLLSDAPLGAFLSAGMDSSSLVAAMHAAGADPIRTYTVTFPEDMRTGRLRMDDAGVAARTAQRFGARHRTLVVEPDVVSLLPELVWHLDDPVGDHAILPAYLVSREASADVKVLLSGVGGDELFAGYRKHLAHRLSRRWVRAPGPMRRLVEAGVKALPDFRGTPLQSTIRLAKKMARSASLPPRERFLTYSTYLDEAEKSELYTDAYADATRGLDPWQRHLERFDEAEGADALNQLLHVDMTTFMVSLNLTYNDRMTMAASVEARVPFLDLELVEWVARSVPPSLKLRGWTTKHVLREAMRPLLPPEVLEQKKAGFAAPVDRWLQDDLGEMVGDLLGPDAVGKRGIFQPDAVDAMIRDHRAGRVDRAAQIWQLLTLELWMRTFIDGRGRPT